jgi:iron complex outermembrane receptor protein
MRKKVSMTQHDGSAGQRIRQSGQVAALKAISVGVLLFIAHSMAQAQAEGQAQGQGQAPAQNTSAPDDSNGAQVQDTVVVKAKALSPADRAKARLDNVPGAVSVVNSDDIKGRSFTNEDVLAYQPGVYAQAAGGTDGIKISIRGSAINRGTNFFRSGALFMFDGLPVTGPGGTPYELFEPLGLSYTEILRGANAGDYGSTMLGGAINYVTKTGYDAAPFELHLEGGSFGYRKEQVSTGKVIGDWDYYVSLTDSHRDGFQTLSGGSARGAVANIGYKISPDLDTRFFIRYRETQNFQPGNLTKAQIATNPSQANPVNLSQNADRIQPGSTWIGSKTTWAIDGASKLVWGFDWHNYPIDQEIGVNQSTWDMQDLSLSLDYTRQDTLWGRQSNSNIGVLSTRHLNSDTDTRVRIPTGVTAGLPVGTLLRHAEYGGADNIVHASNDLEVAQSLWLTTALSMINTQRNTQVTYPVTNSNYQRNTWDFAPRLGLRYLFADKTELFGNLSRSVEAPNSWGFLETNLFTSGPQTGLARAALDLKNQTANTLEVGTRGKTENGSTWSAAVYHSEVRNELLTVEVAPATSTTAAITAETNGSPTMHQGIELGGDTILWQANSSSRHKISLRQAYTLSDFHYKHDPLFGTASLPGVPRHFYQGELQYEHPSGFYASLNTQIASENQVDYANTFHAAGYEIFGATVGYDHPTQGWKVYLDLRNLTNKHYAATVSPGFNDAGADVARSTPGDGIGLFAGVTIAFK